MAFRHPATLVLFFQLTALSVVLTSPLTDCAKLLNHPADDVNLQKLSETLLPLHHKERRSASKTAGKLNAIGSVGLEQTEDFFRLAALLPAETLQMLRMVAVPVLNTTLAVPANILEGASQISLSDLEKNAVSWVNVSEIVSLPSQKLHAFNLTAFEASANEKMHNKLLTPMATFLAFSANKTKGAMPVALDSDHLKKHLANFKRYLMTGANITANAIHSSVGTI